MRGVGRVGREAVIEGCVAHDWAAAAAAGWGEDEVVYRAFEACGVDEGVAPGAAVDESMVWLELTAEEIWGGGGCEHHPNAFCVLPIGIALWKPDVNCA